MATDIIRTLVKGADTSIIKKYSSWLWAAVGLMGTANFIEFLYEEGLQTAGMGIYVAISNKQWTTARDALNKAKKLLAVADWCFTNLGWLAPYAWNVFKNYGDATKLQYDSYEKVIAAQIGNVSDPSAAGKVFNLAEAKANIENGTAPAVTTLIAGVLEAPATIIKIRRITDGDTVVALLPNKAIESNIRLAGIDAPEKGKTGYKESLAWLESQLLGADVTLQVDEANAEDSYGRVIAVIIKNGVDMSLESVKQGWSTYYPYLKNKFVDEKVYKSAEDNARNSNLGIWALTGAGGIAPTPAATTTKKPKAPGILFTITSTPSNAKIFIDNVATHHNTPSDEVEMKDVISLWTAGAHKIRVQRVGYSSEADINLVVGTRTTLDLALAGMATNSSSKNVTKAV